MSPYTYTILHRTLCDTSPLTEALDLTQPQLCALPHLTLVKVLGAQAKTFLQGQLTCDVNLINTTTMQPGALCDLKGRIIALIDVLYWQDSFYLLYPQDLHAIIQHALALAARLSRVQFEPMSTLQVYGLIHPANIASFSLSFTLPTNAYQVHATPELACYAITPTLAIVCCDKTHDWGNTSLPMRGDLPWQQQLIQQKRMTIYPETSGKFLPHRLHLDKIGYVSFQKGCYKGQEIIARMHYRGTQKYTLQLLTHPTNPVLPYPGMQLLNPVTQQPRGEVIDVAPLSEENCYVLASCLPEPSEAMFLS